MNGPAINFTTWFKSILYIYNSISAMSIYTKYKVYYEGYMKATVVFAKTTLDRRKKVLKFWILTPAAMSEGNSISINITYM